MAKPNNPVLEQARELIASTQRTVDDTARIIQQTTKTIERSRQLIAKVAGETEKRRAP
jgi:hypothetical protein